MNYNDIEQINKDLAVTKKAIISLGCSFVEGQGAVDQYLIENYRWTMKETGVPMQPELTETEKREILSRHESLISFENNQWNWRLMEQRNAFVNVLCKKYFENQYTPINFGLRGKGNRASIKSLYFWPQINWQAIEELIVLYVPSGQERFDFVNDEFYESLQFQCMWPHWKDQKGEPKKYLWRGYAEGIYSEKSSALEQISNVIELLTWCKVKKARLIITPAFDKSYNKSSMTNALYNWVFRDVDQRIKSVSKITDDKTLNKKNGVSEDYISHMDSLVDLWPWDKMFYPESCETFIDLCLKQENLNGPTDPGFWDYNGVGTKNHWITVCCHPSAKAHDLFAMRLYEHVIKS